VAILDGVLENLIELGRWAEAREIGDQILARMNISFQMVYTHMSIARMDTLLGRVADAEREIAQASELGAVGPHRIWQLEDAIGLGRGRSCGCRPQPPSNGRSGGGRRRRTQIRGRPPEERPRRDRGRRSRSDGQGPTL
jgi:hypothetical protein